MKPCVKRSMRAVVLGGSVNPPTLAHKALMEHAREQISQLFGGPVKGIYVPSSHNYVARKVKKLPENEQLLFSEEDRLHMLSTFLGKRCFVNVVEYGDDGRGHTHATMRKIHGVDPDTIHMFLLGADKLKVLPKWGNIEKFLTEFTFVVTSRDSDSARALVADNELLAAHKESFIFIPELSETYADYSSTAAREAILKGNWAKVKRLCGEEVTDIIRKSMKSR